MSSRFKPPTPHDLIKGVKSFSSLFSLFGYKPKPNINSILLRLHSTVTSIILVSALTLLTMNAYFGDSIECNTSKSDIPPAQIVRHCWMEGSFSAYPRSYDASGRKDGYPGVETPTEDDKIVYHRYYQWVYFVLVFQLFMFYVPKYVWRKHESSRLVDLIADLRDNHIASLVPFDKYRLLQDVADSMYIGSTYLLYFVLCDILCLFNLILQMWLTNLFLGGGFIGLGFEWYQYTISDTRKHTDPLLRIFPRQVKCSFHKFGFSGTRETIDSLCLLPQNIVNEKIYLFLWAWFMFLLVFTIVVLLIRILYCVKFFRCLTVQHNTANNTKAMLRRLCSRMGNWFILYNISKHVKPSYFVHLLEELIEVHFDKDGKQTRSNIYYEHLSNCVKVSLKRRTVGNKGSKLNIGWNVGAPNDTYNNTSYDYNTSNDNYQNQGSNYVVNWDDNAVDNSNYDDGTGNKNNENEMKNYTETDPLHSPVEW